MIKCVYFYNYLIVSEYFVIYSKFYHIDEIYFKFNKKIISVNLKILDQYLFSHAILFLKFSFKKKKKKKYGLYLIRYSDFSISWHSTLSFLRFLHKSKLLAFQFFRLRAIVVVDNIFGFIRYWIINLRLLHFLTLLSHSLSFFFFFTNYKRIPVFTSFLLFYNHSLIYLSFYSFLSFVHVKQFPFNK